MEIFGVSTVSPPVTVYVSLLTPDPVPHIQNFSTHLAGMTIFSMVDLARSITTCPSTGRMFQILLSSPRLGFLSACGCHFFCFVVASTSLEEHLLHLRLLFERLNRHRLIINPAKCHFGLVAMDLLENHVNPQGVVPMPAKVKAVTAFLWPCIIKPQLEFLGMVNFYNRSFCGQPTGCGRCMKCSGAKRLVT